MALSDGIFKKIEQKTNVDKQSILDLAAKIQNSDLKDEHVLRDVVKQVGKLAGKDVSREKEDKIVNSIINDKVPKDLNEMI